MPEPLMTFKLYNNYIQAMMQSDDAAKKRYLRHFIHEVSYKRSICLACLTLL